MENPSLFKKIYNEIKYLWHQFTGYKNQDQFIEDLRNKWESAYRNQKVQQKAKNIDNLTPTQDDDIRYSIEEVKKEPIKDNTGRELSKQQQEYFKDSKVRDEDGNLIVMNHATPDNTFTVFGKNNQGKNSSKYFKQKGGFGEGFYFSDEEMAYRMWNEWVEQETKKPAKSMKVYLDIKNPEEPQNQKKWKLTEMLYILLV